MANETGASKKARKVIVELKDQSGSKTIASFADETDLKITTLIINESIGKFPSFEINLYGSDFKSITDKKDFKISYVNEYFKFESKVCALTKEYDMQGNVKIKGLFAESKNCIQPETKFLGKNTKSAINTLGFEQKLNLKLNVAVSYYQLSETAVSSLLKICDCEADFPFWSVGVSEIILTKPHEVKDFLQMSNINNIIEGTLPTMKPKNTDYDKVYYAVNLNSYNMLGNTENQEALPQVAKNVMLKERYRPNFIMTGNYEGVYPYKLGTIMKNGINMFPKIDNWIVTSISREVSSQESRNYIQYANYTEKEGGF